MPKENKKRSIIFALLLLMLIIFFHYIGVIVFFEGLSRKILNPVATKTHQFSQKINYVFQVFFTPIEDLDFTNNEQHDQEKEKLKSEVFLLLQENQELRQQLLFEKRNNYKLVSSQVVGKSLEGIEQVLILNKGIDSGININQPVIVGDGILIGKISKVNQQTSFVRLINDNQSKIGATILNRNKSLGIVEGGYGLSLRMKLIPRDEVVVNEESIITSGVEEEIPYGLLIGKVAMVENEPYQPFQQAVLYPSADLSHLNLVSVIIGY